MACLKSLRDAGGNLKISGANDLVVQVLQIVNLYTYVDSYRSADDAVVSFGK